MLFIEVKRHISVVEGIDRIVVVLPITICYDFHFCHWNQYGVWRMAIDDHLSIFPSTHVHKDGRTLHLTLGN